MPKPLNKKCLECSKQNWRGNKEEPKCYIKSVCGKKRSYYRKLDYYRAKARELHRYIKFMGDKCLVCGSTANLEGHHHKSQTRGGEDSRENIVTLCAVCHKVITIYNRRLGIERELISI
jgi:5-methylcytosine-specific restriction endonuclease McrA